MNESNQTQLAHPRPSALSSTLSRSVVPWAHSADHSWAHLWFAVERFSWGTLAVVPVGSADDAVTAAQSLAAAGQLYRGETIETLDATGATAEIISRLGGGTGSLAIRARALIVAVDSPLLNPAAIAVARLVDAVLLVVPVGDTIISDARRIIDVIGRERFIGSIATTAPSAAHPKQ